MPHVPGKTMSLEDQNESVCEIHFEPAPAVGGIGRKGVVVVMPPVPQRQDSQNPDVTAIVRCVEIPISQSMAKRICEKCDMPEANYSDSNDPDQERKPPG